MGDTPLPPFPTNDGGLGASDFVGNVPEYSPASELDDTLAWTQGNVLGVGQAAGAAYSASGISDSIFAFFAKIIASIILHLDIWEAGFEQQILSVELDMFSRLFAPVAQLEGVVTAQLLQLVGEAFGTLPASGVQFGGSITGPAAAGLFNEMILPFTLQNRIGNLKNPGTGTDNQQYLLSLALNLMLQEKLVSDMGNHFGLGILKTVAPYVGMIDRVINPANICRQAMDASINFAVKAPLVRDLNRASPIKDLGLTALAKLYIRGAIDQPTYLDKCQDSGLDSVQAQQLVLESAKLLDPGDLAKIVNSGYLSTTFAHDYLTHSGYQDLDASTKIYLDTHERYFQIQEKVGYQAVNAAKHGYITGAQLEELLAQLGFTQDEITLLEIELQFVKSAAAAGVNVTTEPVVKTLSYGQIKAMFEANIIGVGDVITYLEKEGYSSTDTINLVLLDFTAQTERAARLNTLQARLMAQEQTDFLAANVATTKGETDLAAAKVALAEALKAQSAELGTVLTTGGIIAALGL